MASEQTSRPTEISYGPGSNLYSSASSKSRRKSKAKRKFTSLDFSEGLNLVTEYDRYSSEDMSSNESEESSSEESSAKKSQMMSQRKYFVQVKGQEQGFI